MRLVKATEVGASTETTAHASEISIIVEFEEGRHLADLVLRVCAGHVGRPCRHLLVGPSSMHLLDLLRKVLRRGHLLYLLRVRPLEFGLAGSAVLDAERRASP